MDTSTFAATTASPSVFFIASTGLPPSEITVEQDKVPSILLVLMILLLPSIAIFVGVAVWIIRRIKALPTALDIEKFSSSTATPTQNINRISRFFERRDKERSLGDISGDTLTMNTPLPTIRVISKSPSRDNESLDLDLEKLDYVDFNPEATSTLPRGGSKNLRDAFADLKNNDHEQDKENANAYPDPHIAQAFSSFGISSPFSKTPDATPIVKDRYPSLRSF